MLWPAALRNLWIARVSPGGKKLAGVVGVSLLHNYDIQLWDH
jgi:hypothetical protein